MRKVIKRDGRSVDFDAIRILHAVLAAMKEVGMIDVSFAMGLAKKVMDDCPEEISVEGIQDKVEKELMDSPYKDVARAYIIYRDKRTKARGAKTAQIIADIIATKKNDITRENANMNADTPAGMMMKFSSEVAKQYVDDYLLSEPAKQLVQDNILHVHDKDYYPTKSLTCIQHPIDKILSGGFQAGHGESRPAKRIETASILSCISMETVQNEMHGGQAIPAFDFYMAPYVRNTFEEEIKKIAEDVGLTDVAADVLLNAKITDYLPELYEGSCLVQLAVKRTVNRVHQAMEAFIHNLNTIHSRGGNQVVFSSINYGTDTSAEGRCVIRELLLSTERGVGNGSTAIFPIQIWKKKRGVNFLPGDPNYDLYLLACRVTARRFFPNFLNLDATFNQHEKWNADDPERYEYEVATMGCVDGDEIVSYEFDGRLYVEPISRMWDRFTTQYPVKEAKEEGFDCGYFIDLKNVRIADRNEMVDCLRIIQNPDKGDWMEVSLSNGRVLSCTADHPWTVKGKGVVLTKDLLIDDEIELVDSQLSYGQEYHTPEEAWFKGFFLCDGCYDGQFMATIALNETDIADKYISILEDLYGIKILINARHRGKKGNYLELKGYVSNPKCKHLLKELRHEFKGLQKIFRSFPDWVFNSPRETRSAFLAGIIDADGHINDQRDRAKIQVGSTNKVLALQTLFLAQSLNIPAKMYLNHYTSQNPEAIRYRVEFDATPEVMDFMASSKKYTRQYMDYELIPIYSGKITAIKKIGFKGRCSYDVTTSSEHFNVSGIRSHNCRTRVFENRHGEKTSIARGNLSFSTINLPGLALSVRHIEDKQARIDAFYEKLTEAMNVAAEQLYDRYKFQSTALAKQFPLLMSGMWMDSDKLKPTDPVEPVLKHGTLGMGFIGLAECLVALVGKHHGESEEAQKLGLEIVQKMFDRTRTFSQIKNMNYSVLATPAEGLAGKFTKRDRQKYGVIPGITDREYYTNSNHVPVYYKCSASHKAQIEAPYHEKTRGGHIFYVELDGDATHNVEAVMDVVNLMDRYNMGYGSINHNRNRCPRCGHEDADKNLTHCPICGEKYETIQRITGYLVGTTDRWNAGKLAELKDRVTHE